MNIINFWIKKKIYKSSLDKTREKFFILAMIPYPSGNLHIGHVRNYSICDIICRKKRMEGKNVMYPIGWDAYGLPAENAANMYNIKPEIWTKKNIFNMKKEFLILGISFDWNKEFSTCNPNYTKIEQKLFIKLFKKNLIFKKLSWINWCNNDKTVLANEQIIDNKCWRCANLVNLKFLNQWYLKIQDYSILLEKNLKNLNWSKNIKIMQKNWLKNKIKLFLLLDFNQKIQILIFINVINKNFKYYDYIYININHNILKNILKKTQYLFLLKLKIKYFYISEFFNINILSKKKNFLVITNTYKYKNILAYITIKKLKTKHPYFLNKFLLKTNQLFIIKESNIKNWCISRQRYWGTAIPLFYYLKIINNIPYNLLPIIIKNNFFEKNYIYYNQNLQKNYNGIINYSKNLLEKDTIDTFLETAWYHLKICSDNNQFLNKQHINYWLPIDYYVGGIEHATMHLIYIRFINMLMYNFKWINFKEPINNLICQGILLSNAYYYYNNNQKIWINEIEYKNNKNKEQIFIENTCKISKSKKNFVNILTIIKDFSSDILRLTVNFLSPIEKNAIWNENQLIGLKRFINKLKLFIFQNNEKKYYNINYFNKENIKIKNEIFKYLKLINKNYIDLKFNKVISLIMSLFNFVKKINNLNLQNKGLIFSANKILIKTLYPFCPFQCFKLWYFLFKKKNIDLIFWPNIDNEIK